MTAHVFRFLSRKESSHWVVDEPTEISHALSVLRLKEGAQVEVFDGQGSWAKGSVISIDKKTPLFFVEVNEQSFEEKPQNSLGIFLGLLKPQVFDELIPSLTELGVSDFILFLTQGSPKFRMTDSSGQRWERIMNSSLKQCKRFWRPSVRLYGDISQALEKEAHSFEKKWVLDPSGDPVDKYLLVPDKNRCFAVGSESGLSEEELVELARYGFVNVSLGNYILRSFTAAIAGAVILRDKLVK